MESTDYQQLFNELLALAESRGSHAEKLLFLDGGAEISPQVLANLDHKLNHRVNLDKIPPAWHLYPDLGKIPPIDTQALEFLPPEISEICVCIGGFYEDQVYCQWLGRSPLTPVQMWSTTKIVPMIALIMTTLHRNQNRQIAPIDNWQIDNYALLHIYDRIVDYQDQNFSSNALSAMLKQFFHPLELQSWWQNITGNFSLEFTGLYGEEPYINQPILRDGQQILLTPADVPHRLGQGRNLVSAYDLVRIFTLIGLAHHLSPSARLPWLTTDHYRSITHALARDPAQYVARCLPRVPTFAKMGFGYSAERQRTEIAYGCFVPVHEGQFLSFGLRGYSNLADPDRCARSIDVRVAIAVGQLWQKISNIFTPTDPYLCHA
jgi:hypothetical protein